jgi:hypothetical protein
VSGKVNAELVCALTLTLLWQSIDILASVELWGCVQVLSNQTFLASLFLPCLLFASGAELVPLYVVGYLHPRWLSAQQKSKEIFPYGNLFRQVAEACSAVPAEAHNWRAPITTQFVHHSLYHLLLPFCAAFLMQPSQLACAQELQW